MLKFRIRAGMKLSDYSGKQNNRRVQQNVRNDCRDDVQRGNEHSSSLNGVIMRKMPHQESYVVQRKVQGDLAAMVCRE